MYYYDKEDRGRAAMIDLGANDSVRRVALRTLAELRPLSETVENWMRVLGYPRKDIFAVQLALHEAVSNAFRHGNRGDLGKTIAVRYVATPAQRLLEVEDAGAGFDPGAVPDPLAGRNRPLVLHL